MAQDVTEGKGVGQDQDEKKDHVQHPNGRSEHSDFEDPQANQSKGRRKNPGHGPSGNHEGGSDQQNESVPVNNTTSGGNRPKVPQQTDHN